MTREIVSISIFISFNRYPCCAMLRSSIPCSRCLHPISNHRLIPTLFHPDCARNPTTPYVRSPKSTAHGHQFSSACHHHRIAVHERGSSVLSAGCCCPSSRPISARGTWTGETLAAQPAVDDDDDAPRSTVAARSRQPADCGGVAGCVGRRNLV